MSLKEFSKTLKSFQETIQASVIGDMKNFQSRNASNPIKKIPGHDLPPQLTYLYTNYETLLILPHIHLNVYRSLFPMEYTIDGGRTSQKYNPWKNGKVNFAYSLNENYTKLWADTTQENVPIYVTDINDNYELITPSMHKFFQILIELCKSYDETSDTRPKSGSSFEKFSKHREEVVSQCFSDRIKKIVDKNKIGIIRQVFMHD